MTKMYVKLLNGLGTLNAKLTIFLGIGIFGAPLILAIFLSY